LVLAILILIGLLPSIASFSAPVRNYLLSKAVPNLNGTITAKEASLGWGTPISFKGVEICSEGNIPVVEIDELQGTRPLWKMVLKPKVLGTYTVKKPHLTAMIYPNGATNLSEVFTGADPMEVDPSKPKSVPNVSVAVQLVEGSVTVCDEMGQNAWTAEPINFGFRLKPSDTTPDGRTRLEIPAEMVFDHVQVTPEVCKDMLKYITPTMANATRAEGTFSIKLDHWSLPLDAPGEGTGKGVFTVHELSVGPGPIVQRVLTTLGLSSRLIAIDEAPIQFELVDQRMHHKGLQFHVAGIKFTTSGSVGVKDETLDMTMVVQIPKEVKVERPIIKALAGQSITIPIRGTLKMPEVEVQGLAQSGMKAVTETINRLLDEGMKDPDEKGENKEDPNVSPEIDTGMLIDGAMRALKNRRERNLENREETGTPRFLNPDRGRPVLDRILKSKEEEKENKDQP
jgi:hypothetical protein